MSYATCRTDGCENAEIAIEVEHPVDEDTGQPVDPWDVMCGVCGEYITDITEGKPR